VEWIKFVSVHVIGKEGHVVGSLGFVEFSFGPEKNDRSQLINSIKLLGWSPEKL